VMVPPVPTPATNTSTFPSSASRISGPVVRRWISGFAGLENWSVRNQPFSAARRFATLRKLSWLAGGTFGVIRVIRNRVEFWDRVGRPEQELMIGRDKARGAPLGRPSEQSDPDYDSDPKGERIPLDAHIRLARPRTPKTESERILRRAYNYSRGIDQAGQLDMGLLFVAFNRDVDKQFAKVQKRLAGEPLVDYVKPTGGGYFYMSRGARNSQEWVGADLFV